MFDSSLSKFERVFFTDMKRLEYTKLKYTKLFSNGNIFNAIIIPVFTSKCKHKKDLTCVHTRAGSETFVFDERSCCQL